MRAEHSTSQILPDLAVTALVQRLDTRTGVVSDGAKFLPHLRFHSVIIQNKLASAQDVLQQPAQLMTQSLQLLTARMERAGDMLRREVMPHQPVDVERAVMDAFHIPPPSRRCRTVWQCVQKDLRCTGHGVRMIFQRAPQQFQRWMDLLAHGCTGGFNARAMASVR